VTPSVVDLVRQGAGHLGAGRVEEVAFTWEQLARDFPDGRGR
jgi:hypothetical protein